MKPLLDVRDLSKAFGSQQIFSGVSLSVPRGQIFTILGPSGAGKSVFLKCVAGVLMADGGEIRFDGRVLGRDRTALADFRRRCSFLFQSNALFDSLTALENVALPLEQTTHSSRRETRVRAMEALGQLDIGGFADRYPAQLSGGMQKRLALARAIVTRPEMVFFDEPTAGLDPLRRNKVFAMIARYQHRIGFTAMIVTHDVPEALVTSDHVALLENGRLCFSGTPVEFSASADPLVTAFRDSADALGRALREIRVSDP